jgi:hypothetical protein
MKKTRQLKAKRIIMLSSRRMAARLLAVSTKNIDKDLNEDVCERVRELYERKYKTPDRLLKAYDLASLVR